MSLIGDQVKQLREYSKELESSCSPSESYMVKQAADTIEELSAKLHASQMERSIQYYNDGWISCEDRLPEEHDSMFMKLYGTDKWNCSMWKTQSDYVIVTKEFKDGTRKTDMMRTHDGEWFSDIRIVKFKIIAWKPIPYKEKERD